MASKKKTSAKRKPATSTRKLTPDKKPTPKRKGTPTKKKHAPKKSGATSRHLGWVETNYAAAEISRAGDTVHIDMNVENRSTLAQSKVDTVDRIVDELDRHDATARAAFAAQMTDASSQVPKFWQFHHDEVEEHARLERAAFVPALKLVRAGFYPEGAFDTNSYFVLDYAVRGPNTDQLLVAKFGRDGSLLTISWES